MLMRLYQRRALILIVFNRSLHFQWTRYLRHSFKTRSGSRWRNPQI